jgi:nucleoside-diphosphate-sugar epimerase
MRLLVLGGTAWLSRTVAADAAARGHDVTCLARGRSGAIAEGARLVAADRTSPDAYDIVAQQDWDAVLDVSRQPGQVRGAVDALAGRTAYLAFVSTGNVYLDSSIPEADESASLHYPLESEEMQSPDDYGPAKVACELAVLDRMGADRCLLARSGLIAGPGDPFDRGGYWPLRFAVPGTPDGAVVVPHVPGLDTQLVDVRDLAAWLVDCCERQTPGVVDAVGERIPLADHLQVARAVAGHTGPVLAASPQWLEEHGVNHWMGERSMPLWLPLPEYAGFGSRVGAAARAIGLAPRPLADTLADTLAWEQTLAPDRPRKAGLTTAEAVALVEAWRAG